MSEIKNKYIMKRLKPKNSTAQGSKSIGSRKTTINESKNDIKYHKPSRSSIIAHKGLVPITIQRDKLQKRNEILGTEINKVRCNFNKTSQDRGRMQQFWTIAEIKLDSERIKSQNIEKNMFEMKTKQAEHIQKLQQKIRTLVLNVKNHRNISTQSDPIPPSGTLVNTDCQTMEELNKEKASQLLRQSDDLLMVFINELQKEKLNAQSDLKYAIVQLEQRMKDEMDTKLKTMREEREIEIEEINLNHIEQIRGIEADHAEETATLQGNIEFLQRETTSLRELRDALSTSLEDSRMKLADQAKDMGRMQMEIEEMSKELSALREYKENFRRDKKNVERMKSEMEKYKELNEIIMAEFGNLENERDELLNELRANVERMDLSNRKKYEKITTSKADFK